MHEHVILQLAIIIAIGIGAQWMAWWLRLPSILLLLVGGILVGPVTGYVDADHLFGDLLFPLVSISVGLILFEGGLSLHLSDLPKAGGAIYRLVTVGAVITWGATGLAAWGVLGMDPRSAALLGAILVVTGPTVIIPLLRQIRPSGPVGTVLRWEGIIIDPLGAMLTVLVFEAILVGELKNAPTEAGMAVVRTLLAAPLIGLLAAGILIVLFRRFLIPHYLDNPVALTLVIGAFTGSNAIQPESGLLATTIMGVVLANQRMVDVEHIIEFKENLRVLLLSSLFVILGARMRLDYLLDAGPTMILFLVILIVVVRPLAVLVSTAFTKLEFRERAFLACMAPRGIVAAAISSILALSLEEAGFENAESLVSTTFVVIIATVAVYGLGAAPLARLLAVADPKSQGVVIVGAHEAARRIAQVLIQKDIKVLLVDTNRHDTRAARMEGIAAYPGSILSEHAISEMDLGGIGKLLAMAPSDWVNVLAVQRFSRIFGKAHVYQLSPDRGSERDKAGHRHLYGRRLFGSEITFWTLQARLNGGSVVKATPLTKEFDFVAFRDLYGPSAIPLLYIEEDGEICAVTVGTTHDFHPGQTLISLVDEPKEERARKKES